MGQERISRFGQIQIYIGKCFRLFINEHGWKLLISSAIIAAIISWVAGEDTFQTFKATRSGAFALVCACIWMGIFNSIQSVCRERQIIKREHRTGLHISSYVAAHMIYELVLCLAEALIAVNILFIIRDCPESGIIMPPFIELFITFFLVIYSADVLGIAVSCIVKNENSAMTVMPFVLILQLVMSGTIFDLSGMASIISNFTISKWGVNAICSIADVNSMADTVLVENFNESDYLFSAGHIFFIWFILIFFALLYGVIGTISLKFIDNDKR